MRRKSATDKFFDDIDDLISRIVVLCVGGVLIYIVLLYITDRAAFWRWLIYGALIVAGLIIAFGAIRRFLDNRVKKNAERLLDQVRQTGQEDYIKNFISRFGFEGKATKGWSFRNHKIDWYRIDDLEGYLIEKGVRLRTGEDRDIFALLRYYVQQKEENLTRESIKQEPQRFALLSGTDFEKLLYRLFEAMGYKVEWIGKSGDQGGDLIANKDGERILIQAKCYRDWSTGNAAVQQVVGAMRHYDCNKTMVVTTSTFTDAARALAKSNSTELVSKDQLSEMLIKYLKESWR